MIIARYLIKEIAQTLFGVSLVLMLIGLSGQLVGVFADVTAGNLSLNTVMIVLGLKSLSMFMIILPLSLFLAVLMTLSRLYQNNEMAAISACGISQLYILRIVLSFAVLFAIIVGILSFQVSPWASAEQQKISADAEKASELEGMSAGRFRESAAGEGVMYVESMNEQHSHMQNIFIQNKLKDNTELVIRAKQGAREENKQTGDRFMVLENGVRYEKKPGELNSMVIVFERHGVRIHEQPEARIAVKQTSIPTLELLKLNAPVYKAELHSRIAPVMLCLLLAALAVPLSQTSPRQGRYLRLGFGFVVYIVFTNLINIGKTWILAGTVPAALGLWWVHLVMLGLLIFLLMQQTGFRYLLQRNKL